MKSRLTILENKDAPLARPVLCFIPGGPGLSSRTLRSMDFLSRSFTVAYIDPPGTGGEEEAENPTFAGIVESIEAALQPLEESPLILAGHSFGALYAIELVQRGRLPVAGLAALTSPLSAASYQVAVDLFGSLMTAELEAAIHHFEAEPTRASFNAMMASYGRLYFSAPLVEQGKQLLLGDKSSPRSFVEVLPTFSRRTPYIDFEGHLLAAKIPKLLLAGEEDILFPPEALEKDAKATGAEFFLAKKAGHFVTFDQPEAVGALIEEFFSSGKIKTKGGSL
jgi:pimeloyl-ACP methyl ester carboxylesterase